ncbi:conserved hypothetical protein [Pediculus humanus corporis]|uniref:Uncharacterized protein n=1 Tax=Pediculus humanus subsp. corporis TaxID=121224 RepID=E0VCD4_PEDHC|nr:uncharacterized protein Phum_PHUM085720 [Pediculus humanus corporis]EEB11040.1 conserved hypothetical protein [Pediculus humanus corporis]
MIVKVMKRAVKRCYSCRSRGDLGTCRDPFKVNSTLGEIEKGIEAVPCASGWCSKIIEGDYGLATERQCLSRGPSDSEERCAKTEWNHKKVYMCFCQGDLCNHSPHIIPNFYLGSLLILFTLLN